MKYIYFILVLMIASTCIKISSIRTSSYSLRKTVTEQRKEIYELGRKWKNDFIHSVMTEDATERFYYDGGVSASFKVSNKTQILESKLIDLKVYDSPYDIFIDTKHFMTDTSVYASDNTNYTFNRLLRDEVLIENGTVTYNNPDIKLFSSIENIYSLKEIPNGNSFNEGELNYVMVKNMATEEYVMFNYVYSQMPEEFTTIEIEDLMTITKVKTMTGYYYIYNVYKPCTLVNNLFSTYKLNNKEYDGISIDLKENDVLISEVDLKYIIVDYLVNVDMSIESTLMNHSQVLETTKDTVIISGY